MRNSNVPKNVFITEDKDFNKLKKYSMNIIGERHTPAMIKYYDELMKIKKPEYFIAEFAYNDRIVGDDFMDVLEDRLRHATNTGVAPLDKNKIWVDYMYNAWVYELAYKHKCKLVGIERPITHQFKTMHDEDKYREFHMLEVIKEFEGTNSIVEIGDHHLRSIPFGQGFLDYCGDTIDDRGIVSDLRVKFSSPIWKYFVNKNNTSISRLREYENELSFISGRRIKL